MVIQIQISLIFDAMSLVLNRDIQFLIAAFEFQIGIVVFDFRFDNGKGRLKQGFRRPLTVTSGKLRFFIFGRFLTQTQAQFAQLFVIHRIWRVGQQALGALGFREGNHVADGLGAGH